MNELTMSELHEVSGGAIIVLIGGAFLGGVLAGYVQEKTSQLLDDLSEPQSEPVNAG